MLAYIDSFSGLTPCRIDLFYSHVGSSPMIGHQIDRQQYCRVEITATRGGYKRGDIVDVSQRWIVPRNCVRWRKYGARIVQQFKLVTYIGVAWGYAWNGSNDPANDH